jgi:hypothetical protein
MLERMSAMGFLWLGQSREEDKRKKYRTVNCRKSKVS